MTPGDRRYLIAAPIAGALLAVAAFAWVACAIAAADDGATAPKIAADVQARRAPGAWIDVVVSLEEPASEGGAPVSRARLAADAAVTRDRVLAKLDGGDVRAVREYQALAAFSAQVSDAGLRKLEADPDVVSVALDVIGEGALGQSVPMINADDVHTLGYTGAGSVVAVLDSGVNLSHVDLGGVVVQECFLLSGDCPGGGTHTSGPGAAQDDNGHGTNVTGIITSDGNAAPKGVAPDAEIAAYKVLRSNNTGFPSDWIAALDDIIANHPEVDAVNMSLVASSFANDCDSFLPAGTSAIETLRAAGVLTFVSSGNNALKSAMSWPACVTDAVAVGAVWDANFTSQSVFGCTDAPANQDQVTCWSNSSPMLDLLAPGAPTTSAGLLSAPALSTFYGTSMAAPHVTGLAALLKESEPGLTAAQVEQRMKDTGIARTDAANGRTTARIDALNAITGTIPPTPTPTPTPTPGPDADGDGCSDSEENGANHTQGGERDMNDYWDFYDVNGSKAIDLQDTLVVLQHFGHGYNGGAYVDATDNVLDRIAPNMGMPWLSEETNDGIDLVDALANLKSFGDSCAAPP